MSGRIRPVPNSPTGRVAPFLPGGGVFQPRRGPQLPLDYDLFVQALDLFHRYSLQNDEAVRQMQQRGILPTAKRDDLSVLDIGAGQGHLPSLIERYTDKLVLLEPNPRCAQRLRERFPDVHQCLWGELALRQLSGAYPRGFDLITMSHVLYHFNGLEDIREKISMALNLLKLNGHLIIIINQESAPMARIGMEYQLANGRLDEWATNRDLHAFCHEPSFYQALSSGQADVGIYPIDSPLRQVDSREALITLFRMPLLNPLSEESSDTNEVDGFIADFLDSEYPALTYPATIPSHDDLIIIRLCGA